MKRIEIANGIKTSLAELINESQNIFTGNYTELVAQMFTPGFFVKKTAQGVLDLDWAPSITTNGSRDIIQIDIKGRNPAFAYTNGGKIIGLFGQIKIDPMEINGYKYYNPTGVTSSVAVEYELWVIPLEVDTKTADYLPNYKSDGQTKPFVKSYVPGLLLVKVGERPPTVLDATAAVNPLYELVNPLYELEFVNPLYVLDNNGVTTPRVVLPTVEGVHLANFKYESSTGTITVLNDKRGENRAYLKPELYDFFSESYLKHDYLLTHAENSSGDNVLAFNKNLGNIPPSLSGRFTLIGARAKATSGVTTYPAKIAVVANNTSIPVNSVIGVTLTAGEYTSNQVISKPLEVKLLNEFSPTVDFLVIGYHVNVHDPTSGEDQPGGVIPVIDNLSDESGEPSPVNSEKSTLYFVNGLPPLPPGQFLSRTGIGSYILTKDEASAAYYNKTKSDVRFIPSGNNTEDNTDADHYSNLWHKRSPGSRGDDLLTGVKLGVDERTRAGYAWLNSNSQQVAYIIRDNIASKFLEIALFDDSGQSFHGIRLENGHLKTVSSNLFPGSDPNNFVTAAHTILNMGGTGKGNYQWVLGNTRYYKPNDTFSLEADSDNDGAGSQASGFTRLAWEFLYNTNDDVIADAKNHIITGVKRPRKDYPSDVVNLEELTVNNNLIINELRATSEFDSIIVPLETRAVSNFSYYTVKEAMAAGKRRIKITTGTYNIQDYPTGFWPDAGSSSNAAIIKGTDGTRVIINGENYIAGNHVNLKIENIIFRNTAPYSSYKTLEFERVKGVKISRCSFIGQKTLGAPSSGTIGIDLEGIIKQTIDDSRVMLHVDDCYFQDNLMGIGLNVSYDMSSLEVTRVNRSIIIENSLFDTNIVSITPVKVCDVVIRNNNFTVSGYLDGINRSGSYIIFGSKKILLDTGTRYLESNGYYSEVSAFDDAWSTTKTIIEGNTFYNRTYLGAEPMYSCIEINSGSDRPVTGQGPCNKGRIIIRDNHFLGVDSAGTVGISVYFKNQYSISSGGLLGGDQHAITMAGNTFFKYDTGGFLYGLKFDSPPPNPERYYQFAIGALSGGTDILTTIPINTTGNQYMSFLNTAIGY